MLNLNSKKMKKLINGFLVIIAVIFLTMSCKKEITNQTEKEKVGSIKEENNENFEKSNWPFSIGITFEPLRIHRATTDRPRDGKNCGCNECFGLCNSPALGDGSSSESVLGVELIDENIATIYFLHEKPKNFENEFGIDEVVSTKLNSGKTIKFHRGEYKAVYKEGKYFDKTTGENHNYYGSVNVKYSL